MKSRRENAVSGSTVRAVERALRKQLKRVRQLRAGRTLPFPHSKPRAAEGENYA